MKHLKEIAPQVYDAGREAPADPIDIDDDKDVLYFARFRASEARVAYEGLVSARGVGDDEIDFYYASGDGEKVGLAYRARIDNNGIIGGLVLRDDVDLETQEGYFLRYGDPLDDELAEWVEKLERSLVPVHVVMGGAAAEQAKRQLAYRQQDREL